MHDQCAFGGEVRTRRVFHHQSRFSAGKPQVSEFAQWLLAGTRSNQRLFQRRDESAQFDEIADQRSTLAQKVTLCEARSLGYPL